MKISEKYYSIVPIPILDADTIQFLTECTAASGKSVSNMKLLYKATVHGFKASDFHGKCDNKAPTLVIIKNDQNQVFGGFTKQNWNHGGWKQDAEAFIFSVTARKKYSIKPDQVAYAIRCYSNYGPTFGGGHDIYICDNSNTSNSSNSYAGHTYNNVTYQELTGTKNFKCLEIEVFELA